MFIWEVWEQLLKGSVGTGAQACRMDRIFFLSITHFKNLKYKKRSTKLKSKNTISWGTWLAQLVKDVTLGLGVMSSSPTRGVEISLKIKS